jgi:hypothetical protein
MRSRHPVRLIARGLACQFLEVFPVDLSQGYSGSGWAVVCCALVIGNIMPSPLSTVKGPKHEMSQPRKKPKPRRRPHNAQTDYARWALRQLDLACYERAARDET